MTMYEHTTHELKCDICGKPKQEGETDIVNFAIAQADDDPIVKSMDVCRDCRTRPISDLLVKLSELGHVFGVRRSSEAA